MGGTLGQLKIDGEPDPNGYNNFDPRCAAIYPGTYALAVPGRIFEEGHPYNCSQGYSRCTSSPAAPEVRHIVIGPKLSATVSKSKSKRGLTTVHLLSVTDKSAMLSVAGQSQQVALAAGADPNVFTADVALPWTCKLADAQYDGNITASPSAPTESKMKLAVNVDGVPTCDDTRWIIDLDQALSWIDETSATRKAFVRDQWGIPTKFRFCLTTPSKSRVCQNKTTSTYGTWTAIRLGRLATPGRYRWTATFPSGDWEDSGSFVRKHRPKPKPVAPPRPCYSNGVVIFGISNSSCSEARALISRIGKGLGTYLWRCQRTGFRRGSCYLPAINSDNVRPRSFSFRPR